MRAGRFAAQVASTDGLVVGRLLAVPPIVALLAVLPYAEASTTCTVRAAVLAAREPFGEHSGWDDVSDAVAVVVPAALLDVGRAAVPLC